MSTLEAELANLKAVGGTGGMERELDTLKVELASAQKDISACLKQKLEVIAKNNAHIGNCEE